MNLDDLRANEDIWHFGTPYRLVHIIWKRKNREKWMVKAFFVDLPERGLVICKKDEFHPAKFHSQSA